MGFSKVDDLQPSCVSAKPNMLDHLDYNHIEAFVRDFFHQRSLGIFDLFLFLPDVLNVNHLGKEFPAANMVHASVKAGKIVCWLVRASGSGPGCFASPKEEAPYCYVLKIGLLGHFPSSKFKCESIVIDIIL